MPTLEELLNLKSQSLSSFTPKEDTEEAIVADALAASPPPFYPTPDGAPVPEEKLALTPSPRDLAASKNAPAIAPAVEKSQQPDADVSAILQLAQKQKPQYEDLLNRYKDAQERQRAAQLGVALGQAGERIGSAIAMVKPGDQGIYEQLAKQAGGITEEFKDEEAVRREAEKSDPKSETSVSMRNLLKQQGITVPDNISAAFIEKQYPQFANILTRREAAKERVEARRERAEDKAEAKSEKEKWMREDRIAQARREITTGKIGELRQSYVLGQRGIEMLKNAISDPSGYKDLAATYLNLKATQGDASVIREAEMKLGLSIGSIPERLKGGLVRFLTGQMYAPEQRKKMLDSLTFLTEQNKRAYLSAIEPVKKSLEDLPGMSKEESARISSKLTSIQEDETLPKDRRSTIKLDTKLTGKAGKTVTDSKTGKRYVINQDETTATEM